MHLSALTFANSCQVVPVRCFELLEQNPVEFLNVICRGTKLRQLTFWWLCINGKKQLLFSLQKAVTV